MAKIKSTYSKTLPTETTHLVVYTFAIKDQESHARDSLAQNKFWGGKIIVNNKTNTAYPIPPELESQIFKKGITINLVIDKSDEEFVKQNGITYLKRYPILEELK